MLEIINLSVSLTNQQILKNLSFKFNEGKSYAVVGKNGVGKSTLLKAIEGLISYEGEVKYNDIDTKSLKAKQRAKVMSYLPQNRPLPSISGRLMIEHGRFPHLSFSKVLKENDIKIVEEAINKTNVAYLSEKKLDQMSGGEVQKIYITSIIAQQSNIILLDEPSAHLDLENQLEILNLVNELKKDNKIVIVVIHDLLQAFSYFDEVIVIDNQTIALSGEPSNIVNNIELEKIFGYKIINSNNKDSLYKYELSK